MGGSLPRSILDAAARRSRQLALRVLDAWAPARPGAARAVLHGVVELADRRSRLRHALAIGGGYVELRRADCTVIATVQSTPLDLDRGLVGPAHVTPAHASRFEPEGGCPACGGTGFVRALDPALVITDARSDPNDLEAYFRPEAASLLKGVWRTEFRPFLRRMAEEGLLAHLADTTWIRFGYWHRPGYGSFLKNTRADPDEVASWLRWDGLDARLQAELPRSRHTSWRSAVEASLSEVRCPTCEGSGHGVTVRLLTLGGRRLDAWIRSGSIGELCAALQAMPLDRPRQLLTRDRVLKCFEPLVRSNPGAPLQAPASAYPMVAREAMRRFTDLEYGT